MTLGSRYLVGFGIKNRLCGEFLYLSLPSANSGKFHATPFRSPKRNSGYWHRFEELQAKKIPVAGSWETRANRDYSFSATWRVA